MIQDLINSIQLPQGKILFLHVKLREIAEKAGRTDYLEIAREIVDGLRSTYSPRAILVPTFTYTFTKSGIYHHQNSCSEVGRFSEEFRLNFGKFRSPDPVFSVADDSDLLQSWSDVNYSTAFGPGCLWEKLTQENYIQVNLGLGEFISTQLHYIEKLANVPYRYDKAFQGKVCFSGDEFSPINYDYYVRDLDRDTHWDRSKILQTLVEAGAAHCSEFQGIEANWVESQSMTDILLELLALDREYFLLNPDG